MSETMSACSRRTDGRSSSAFSPAIISDLERRSRTRSASSPKTSPIISRTVNEPQNATLIFMAAYLDSVPLSGIIRIRDLMFTVKDPFRLDQGDVSFDAPDTVKSAMASALAENKTHYLQTNGVPRLRELVAAKLRQKNGIPVVDAEDVLVTNGGI